MGWFDSVAGAFNQVSSAVEQVTDLVSNVGGAVNTIQGMGGGSAPLYLPPAQPYVFAPPSSATPLLGTFEGIPQAQGPGAPEVMWQGPPAETGFAFGVTESVVAGVILAFILTR
jgi:hypothetical protein